MATPTTTSYDVRVANLSVLNRRAAADARVLVEGSPHVVAVCEARRGWAPVLPRVPGYRWLGAATGSIGRREVGLLLRDDVEVVDAGSVRLSRAVPGSVVAHDRWGAWARVLLPGGVRALAWSTHRNAYVQDAGGGVRPDEPGTREYAAHARAETDLLHRERAAGWPVLGGGDYNYRVPRGVVGDVDRAWAFSPHRSFAAMGLRYVPHWYDGVVLDPAAFEPVGGLEVIRRDRTGSDHDWLTQSVVPVVPVTTAPTG